MKTFIPIIILGFTFFGFSNPTHGQTIANIIPVVGQSVILDIAFPITEPGASGTGVVWDFSQLTFVSETEYEIIQAESAPGAENYPSATIAIGGNISSDLMLYSFYDFSGGNVKEVGNYTYSESEDFESVITFPVPHEPYTIPLSPGSSGSGNYETLINMFGVEISTPYDYVWEVDASGTLILPNAIYHNVLRVKGVSTHSGIFLSEENTLYTWLVDGIPFPLLSLSIDVQDYGNGNVTETIDAGALISFEFVNSVSEVGAVHNLIVSPNPTNARLNFSIAREFGRIHAFSITDVTGKEIHRKNIYPQAGEVSMDIADLPSGVYMLVVEGDGNRAATRFMKE